MNKSCLENVYLALLIVKNVDWLETALFVVETKLYLRVFVCKSVRKVSTLLMGDVLHVCCHVANVMVAQTTNALHVFYHFSTSKVVVYLHALQTISLTYKIDTAENVQITVHYAQVLKIVHYAKMAII